MQIGGDYPVGCSATAAGSIRGMPPRIADQVHTGPVIPVLAALVVLVALWPITCMGQGGEGTVSCNSLLVRFPWGESADTWGTGIAIGGAVLTYVVLRRLLRLLPGRGSRRSSPPDA